MELNTEQKNIVRLMQDGLPLAARPYEPLAGELGISEASLLEKLQEMDRQGIIKRFGIIVKHRQLGYLHNGMVVWDVPDDQVDIIAKNIAAFDFVNLCYQRVRHLPDWPYNLFCMIHGKSREMVRNLVQILVNECGLENIPRDILFSTECYKQRGARYF